jgi:hypothetical protein
VPHMKLLMVNHTFMHIHITQKIAIWLTGLDNITKIMESNLLSLEDAWFKEGNNWEGINHVLTRTWLVVEHID